MGISLIYENKTIIFESAFCILWLVRVAYFIFNKN